MSCDSQSRKNSFLANLSMVFVLALSLPGAVQAQAPRFGGAMAGQGSAAMPPQGWNNPAARIATASPQAMPTLPNDGASISTPFGANSATPSATPSAASTGTLRQWFAKGGILMYPIALCSLLLTAFSVERWISLRQGHLVPKPFVKRLLEQVRSQQLEKEEAIELCERNPSEMSDILLAALRKYGRPQLEIEQAVVDAGDRSSQKLKKNLRVFHAISNVAPLLGLLGTVLGMMESFNAIATSSAIGRPDLLAGGIGQALITTAAGLLVAIPAYLASIYFLSKVDRALIQMDHYSQQLVDMISAEGLCESEGSRGRSRSKRAA
ncbi:MAG: MotA/TolQ/ExbB proton channel family protein [Pirellulaceae bacterium]